MPLILLATSAAHAGLTADDRLLAAALRRLGAEVRPAVWDDASVDWALADAIVVRSTWDYHLRREEFLRWVDRVGVPGAGGRTRLHNAPGVVRWNSHKGYLLELARAGVPIIPTVLVRRGEPADLATIAAARGWTDLVVKPAVSASAWETRRFGADERGAARAHLERVLASGDALVQPWLPALGARGEASLVYVAGAFSHAVRRRSALSADADDGPRVAPLAVGPEAVALGERILAAAALASGTVRPPLYARVDLAESGDDRSWRLLELELIEPNLYFAHAPGAAERMAAELMRTLEWKG